MFNPDMDPEMDSREPEEKPPQKEGLLGKLREKIQGTVDESKLPSEGYDSVVGVYGGKLKYDEGDRMFIDRTGFVSKFDKTGDAVIRTVDEHVVKEPGRLLKKHPKIAIEKLFAPGAKRYRGSNEEVLKNVERLGLSDYYGPHEKGIEIKKPELFTKGFHLLDIYRADIVKPGEQDELERLTELKSTDRFEALEEAAKYARRIHDEHGAVGELNMFHFLFPGKKPDGTLQEPVLYMPDIVWNEKKKTSEADKKTTDTLDFLSTVFFEEERRSHDPKEINRALDTVIRNYGDPRIIALVASFIGRGRLTLRGDAGALDAIAESHRAEVLEKMGIEDDGGGIEALPKTKTRKLRGVFGQHNAARLGSKESLEGEMKVRVKDACERFLSQEGYYEDLRKQNEAE